MEQGSASEGGKRRSWTKAQEDALLDILDTVVANGGRADNGSFKTGMYKTMEEQLEAVIPGCGLKANPHIDSKIRAWKKVYATIYDMLNTSGFGWNDIKKCVEVDSDDVWKSYVECHRDASKWRDKPFPLYERFVNIFGRDRATGLGAETPTDMMNEPEEMEEENMDVDDGAPSNARSQPEISTRKRRRSEDGYAKMDKLILAFQQANTENVQAFTLLAERMIPSDNNDNHYVAENVRTLGLPIEDELLAVNLILEKQSNVQTFKAICNDSERKQVYVNMLLREKRSGL